MSAVVRAAINLLLRAGKPLSYDDGSTLRVWLSRSILCRCVMQDLP